MAASSDLVFKSAGDLGKLIRSRAISPVEVVEAFLDRTEALNPRINAFITITRERALQEARQAEKEIRAGKCLGPLHGIPYAPKDILATKGIRTTNGSKVTGDWVPDYTKALTGRVKGLRVGVPKNYFFDNAHAEVDAAVRAAIHKLGEIGAAIVDVEVPHAKYAGSAGWIVAMAEAACFHEKRLREKPQLFDPLVRERLEAAKFYRRPTTSRR